MAIGEPWPHLSEMYQWKVPYRASTEASPKMRVDSVRYVREDEFDQVNFETKVADAIRDLEAIGYTILAVTPLTTAVALTYGAEVEDA